MQIVTAAAHLGALAGAEDGGQLNDMLAFFAQPKLLVIDALGYLLLEQRGAHHEEIACQPRSKQRNHAEMASGSQGGIRIASAFGSRRIE